MSKERAYNFSAGPSMLPLSVIEDAAANLANYKGCLLYTSQVSASITYIESPAEIAFVGHSSMQAPQLMHESLIT